MNPEELVNAIGAIAELAVAFYHSAIESGADKDEAKMLTKILVQTLMGKNN